MKHKSIEDFNLIPVENIVIEKLSSAPTGTEARLYYDTTADSLYFYNGVDWIDTAGTTNLTGAITSSGSVTSLGSFSTANLNTALNDNDIATLAGTEELTNKTLNASVGKGTWAASGTWTLPAITLGGDVQLSENISILLDSALSADGKWCGISEAGVLGETVAFGEICYFKAADSRWWLADASAVSTSGDVKIGVCVVAGSAAGASTILLYGKVRADSKFPTLTISAPVYISETAGAITQTAPTTTDSVSRKIGHANSTDELYVNISNDYYTHV